jgi:hypothetical protein
MIILMEGNLDIIDGETKKMLDITRWWSSKIGHSFVV